MKMRHRREWREKKSEWIENGEEREWRRERER